MKLNDLTGKTYGRLTVLERAEDAIKPSGKRETQWLCRCSCNKQLVVRYKNLVSEHTISCGCIRKKQPEVKKAPKERKLRDLIGQTFEKLTVIERAEDAITPSGKRETQWLCSCSCGKQVVVRDRNLVSKHTTSCGCAKKKQPEVKKTPKERKKQVNTKVLTRCIYEPRGVECDDMTKCNTCGWNPKNTELRKQRIERMNLDVSGEEHTTESDS